MDAQKPLTKRTLRAEEIVKIPKEPVSRRALLKLGMLGMTATTLAGIDTLAWAPKRVAEAAPAATAFPDVQFDLGNFIGPVQSFSGVQVRFGPVYTVFLTASLDPHPLPC